MIAQNETLIATRLRLAREAGRSALIPFCVAGHPSRQAFAETLLQIDEHADLIEIGLPFSDPVADGPVIADISRERAAAGVSLTWLFACLTDLPRPLKAAPILFSYLNPLLAFGLEAALERMAELRFGGLVVPDLPLEESASLRAQTEARGLCLIQLVTPLTSPSRCAAIAKASQGFLYAVLRSGITGTRTEVGPTIDFLRQVRAASPLPVCAGFGLRDRSQVDALKHEVDGLIVGSALVAHLDQGHSPTSFLQELHNATHLSSQ